ncbi:hypothetical protein ACNVED_03880 [Legionella sp. D16C41]|uniref:hypothetical protein n=1 Tax=Legionella sp. D16C41 TaxID=3402688 RepID=UPI003AF545CF
MLKACTHLCRENVNFCLFDETLTIYISALGNSINEENTNLETSQNINYKSKRGGINYALLKK